MYYAKQLEEIKLPGCWSEQIIGIFKKDCDEQIGEFKRNYGSFGTETFAPFVRGENWYALYSKRYTGLSVMALPSCEHLGSEETEDKGHGFCPVEVYIPRYQWLFDRGSTEEEMRKDKIPECNWGWVGKDRYTKEYDDGDSLFNEGEEKVLDNILNCYTKLEPGIFYENYAFISGCHWGDDNSWKIELRDISKAHEGIITEIDDRGYFELARKLDLKEAIHLSAFQQYSKEEETSLNITMAVSRTVRLHTISKKLIDFGVNNE